MKRLMHVVLVVGLMVSFAQGLWAADAAGLLKDGMRDLKIEKGSPGLLFV
jgi:hypothetical protein